MRLIGPPLPDQRGDEHELVVVDPGERVRPVGRAVTALSAKAH